MPTCRYALLAAIILASAASAIPAAGPPEKPETSGKSWYRSPSLAVMTGFIYEPKKPYAIRDWEKGLGSRLDADRWVADFKEAGASYLIFYDKWIDGFVFHDTKTTGFKTRRDFVRQIADACHRGRLPLVFYFNAVSDGNPEFDQWAVRDRAGNPIVFSPDWPTRYQTLHSPFRKASVEQVRELLTGYGPIHGMWLDIFAERLNTNSPYVAKGYEAMYGEPFEKASGERLAEFNARTLAAYLDEVRPIAAKHQPDCVWTANGAGSMMLHWSVWNRWVGPRLEYGSDEGHSFHRNDELARMAWVLGKPTEVGLLLCKSWFTPLEDKAPPAAMTEKQAIAATAIAVCQGATVFFALTPDHSGRFGEDLQRAKAAGAWFKPVEPLLRGAQPYADLGIVLGAPAADGPGLPGANTLWKRHEARPRGAWPEAVAVSDALGRAGAMAPLVYAAADGGSWPASLAAFRAVLLPEQAVLDDARVEELRQYVKQGGRLIAFGHASMLDAKAQPRKDFALADVFGARFRGEVAFPAAAVRTQVKADSEYSPEFAAANLVDGRPTAWASGGTPMPHWAEIALAEPVEVAKVEVVSRDGSYLVHDLDIELPEGSAWKTLKSVRNAKEQIISVAIDPPVRAERLRVKVLRETYQGQDRQYADLEAVRVFDKAGRDHATNQSARYPMLAADADVKEAFAQHKVLFLPMAVRVEPTTAEVAATLDDPGRTPAILRNRFGRGEAWLVTTGEGAMHEAPAFWDGLRQLVVGRPTIACQGQRAARCRILLTQAGKQHVLHVIDPEGGNPGWQAADVTISLEAERLGSPVKASLIGGAAPLETRKDAGGLTFTVRPDPVATVVLQ